MNKIGRDEILDLTTYEHERAEVLVRIIALKKARRVAVGDEVTFIFENHDSAWFQVQEMLRTERIVQDDRIQAEIDVYNDFVPDEGELRATMMIEIQDRARIRETLDRLVGIDEHVFLDVDGRTVRATFDQKQFDEERISAVQYVRFVLAPDLIERFRDPAAPVRLRIEHPHYAASASIEGPSRASLIEDLATD